VVIFYFVDIEFLQWLGTCNQLPFLAVIGFVASFYLVSCTSQFPSCLHHCQFLFGLLASSASIWPLLVIASFCLNMVGCQLYVGCSFIEKTSVYSAITEGYRSNPKDPHMVAHL